LEVLVPKTLTASLLGHSSFKCNLRDNSDKEEVRLVKNQNQAGDSLNDVALPVEGPAPWSFPAPPNLITAVEFDGEANVVVTFASGEANTCSKKYPE
jgi:uncharacterized membrane protein